MPIDKKYGRVTLENQRNVGEDEPVIVFRAKDRLLPSLLRAYYSLCVGAHSPENHLAAIIDTRETIEKWQAENGAQIPRSEGYDPRD